MSTGTTGDLDCEAPGILLVCDNGPNTDPFQAIGVGCPGAPENTIPIAQKVFNSQPIAWRAVKSFGTGEDPNAPGELLFRPREGEKFLIVSTGRLPMPGPDGSLVETEPQYDNDNNFNPDLPNELPAPMSPLPGSNGGQGGTPFVDCDGVNDCSDSIEPNWTLGGGDPNDLLFGSFEVQVPGGVDGFLFDAVFFSSEYPEFVGDKFNDMFIGWSTSEAYTGNVTFFEGQPFTVTALAEAMENAGYVGDAPELAGTGFEGHGSTGWVTIQAPVVPGETFTFAFAIMDMGDSSKATATIVDNWRWDCKGCVPIEVDPNCGKPNHPKCCGLCVDPAADPLCDTEGHPKCCVAG
ncbi:MAG TPA: choice-of-anchor L domain-containing protein [Nannocystis sp.]